MTIQPHDFSRAPSLHPETRAKLVQWLTRTNSLLADTVAGFALPVETRLDACTTAWPIEFLQEWSEKTVADVSPVSAIALPSPLAQILIGTMLGEQPTEWPAERDLTPAEQSVAEFFVSNLVTSLVEGWAGDLPLDLQLCEREPNLRRTKIFKLSQPFIVCRSTVSTPFGTARWCWIMPHEFLSKLFGAARITNTTPDVSTRQQLESLARDMTTQVTIRLGGVQLSAPQLAELRVGDLVVLNQKTNEPLRAMVSGKPRFLGWPGRVGNRQAFEVAIDGARRERLVDGGQGVATAASR
jgi:flagellar motor switch protein FliM